MEKFRTATYEVHNPKIKKSVRFAVLADLHGSIFGEENSAFRYFRYFLYYFIIFHIHTPL